MHAQTCQKYLQGSRCSCGWDWHPLGMLWRVAASTVSVVVFLVIASVALVIVASVLSEESHA